MSVPEPDSPWRELTADEVTRERALVQLGGAQDAGTAGPTVRVTLTCYTCRYVQEEFYQVQGDSGCKVSCRRWEPARHIADSRWDTPDWCPYRAVVNEVIREALNAQR